MVGVPGGLRRRLWAVGEGQRQEQHNLAQPVLRLNHTFPGPNPAGAPYESAAAALVIHQRPIYIWNVLPSYLRYLIGRFLPVSYHLANEETIDHRLQTDGRTDGHDCTQREEQTHKWMQKKKKSDMAALRPTGPTAVSQFTCERLWRTKGESYLKALLNKNQ